MSNENRLNELLETISQNEKYKGCVFHGPGFYYMRVWHVAKEFLHFMCYRRNVNLQSADLSTPARGGKTQKFATLYPLDDVKDYEPETLQKGRYIN